MRLVGCKLERRDTGYIISVSKNVYVPIKGMTELLDKRGVDEIFNWDMSLGKSHTKNVNVITRTDLMKEGEKPGVITLLDLRDCDSWMIVDRFGIGHEHRPPVIDIIKSSNVEDTKYQDYGKPGMFLLAVHTSRNRNGFKCTVHKYIGDEVIIIDPFTGNRK